MTGVLITEDVKCVCEVLKCTYIYIFSYIYLPAGYACIPETILPLETFDAVVLLRYFVNKTRTLACLLKSCYEILQPSEGGTTLINRSNLVRSAETETP